MGGKKRSGPAHRVNLQPLVLVPQELSALEVAGGRTVKTAVCREYRIVSSVGRIYCPTASRHFLEQSVRTSYEIAINIEQKRGLCSGFEYRRSLLNALGRHSMHNGQLNEE